MYMIFVGINKTYIMQQLTKICSALHGHEDEIMSKNLVFSNFFSLNVTTVHQKYIICIFL